ncbi:MAG: M48 family metalloprotease [Pseudomonadota bacterium]
MMLACAVPARVQAQSLIRDSEIERTLDAMTRPILAAAGLPPQSVAIYIINDRSLNAFVAGGRNMFLHTGLMIELDTPEQLQGVIAHEIGHIAGGHQARRQQALESATGPALLGLALGIAAAAAGAGEAGLGIGLGAQGAVQRALLSYSRGEEAAADQAALSYMNRAGIDPRGLRDVIARFRGQEVLTIGQLDPYTQTHPLSTDRMQLIDRAAEAAAAKTWTREPGILYAHARMRAKLSGFLESPRGVLEGKDDDELVAGLGAAEAEEITLYRRAIAEHRLPDLDASLVSLDRLLGLRPDDPYYWELKGQVLYESGRAADAVPAYRRAVTLAPGAPLLLAGLGRALLALDQPDASAEALVVLERARRDDPGDPFMLRALAVAYDRAGNRGMATLVTAERFALIGRPRDAMFHAERAAALLPSGSPAWLRAEDLKALAPRR